VLGTPPRGPLVGLAAPSKFRDHYNMPPANVLNVPFQRNSGRPPEATLSAAQAEVPSLAFFRHRKVPVVRRQWATHELNKMHPSFRHEQLECSMTGQSSRLQ
jgi:hypothetical protein